MLKRLTVTLAPLLLTVAACGGTSESQITPFESIDDACFAYSAALGDFPAYTPQLTTAGLNEWAADVRVVADRAAAIAVKTEGTDPMLYSLIKAASDGMYRAAETTEQAAQDPSEANIKASNQALEDGSQAIRDVTTSCTSGS